MAVTLEELIIRAALEFGKAAERAAALPTTGKQKEWDEWQRANAEQSYWSRTVTWLKAQKPEEKPTPTQDPFKDWRDEEVVTE